MSDKLIKIVNLKKDFHVGEIIVHALCGINLEIKEGEFTAIMGASGSGKSTMLNILGCLETPTSGNYFLDDIDMGEMNNDQLAELRNHKLGFVFQSYNLLSRTTALENVELPLYYNNNINSKERRERAIASLEAVGLADRMNHMPNQLSGGQQQRVAIARSLVNDPRVILADEATGNLDTRTSYEIMALFQKLNREGKTIIFVTHEPDIANFMKRNIVFKDGHIIKEKFIDKPLNAQEMLEDLPVQNSI